MTVNKEPNRVAIKSFLSNTVSNHFSFANSNNIVTTNPTISPTHPNNPQRQVK